MFRALIFLILLICPKINARECSSDDYSQKKLLKNTPHLVDKITCSKNGKIRWEISNRRLLRNKRQIASINDQREIIHQKNTSKFFHALEGGLRSSTSSIRSVDTATNTTEKAVTEIGYGFHFKWSHLWSEKLKYFISFSMEKYRFKASTGRTLANSSLSRKEITTGLNYAVNGGFRTQLALSLKETILLTSGGGTNLILEKVAIPKVTWTNILVLHQFESGFRLSTDINLSALTPTSQPDYETEFGYSYSLGLSSSFNAIEKSFHIKTSYEIEELDFGAASQTSKALKFGIGMQWSF